MMHLDLVILKDSYVCVCVLSSHLSCCLLPLCYFSWVIHFFVWFGGCVVSDIICFPPFPYYTNVPVDLTMRSVLWVLWFYHLFVVCWLLTSPFWGRHPLWLSCVSSFWLLCVCSFYGPSTNFMYVSACPLLWCLYDDDNSVIYSNLPADAFEFLWYKVLCPCLKLFYWAPCILKTQSFMFVLAYQCWNLRPALWLGYNMVIYNIKLLLINGKDVNSYRYPWPPWYLCDT